MDDDEDIAENPFQDEPFYQRGDGVLYADPQLGRMAGAIVLRTGSSYDLVRADGSVVVGVNSWLLCAAKWRGHYVAVRNLLPDSIADSRSELRQFRELQLQQRATAASTPEVAVERSSGRMLILDAVDEYDSSFSEEELLLRLGTARRGVSPLAFPSPLLGPQLLLTVGSLQHSDSGDYYFVQTGSGSQRIIYSDAATLTALNELPQRLFSDDRSVIFHGRVALDGASDGYSSWTQFEQLLRAQLPAELHPVRLPDAPLSDEDGHSYYRVLLVAARTAPAPDSPYDEAALKAALKQAMAAAVCDDASSTAATAIGVTIEEVQTAEELTDSERQQALDWLCFKPPDSKEELLALKPPSPLPAGSSQLLKLARRRYLDKLSKAKRRKDISRGPSPFQKISFEEALQALPQAAVQRLRADATALAAAQEFHDWDAPSDVTTAPSIRDLSPEELASPVVGLLRVFRRRAQNRRRSALRRQQARQSQSQPQLVARKGAHCGWSRVLPMSWWRRYHLRAWLSQPDDSEELQQVLAGYARAIHAPVLLTEKQKEQPFQLEADTLKTASSIIDAQRDSLYLRSQLVASAAYARYAYSRPGEKHLHGDVLNSLELTLRCEHAKEAAFRESAPGYMQRAPLVLMQYGDQQLWANVDDEDVPYFEDAESSAVDSSGLPLISSQPADIAALLPLPLPRGSRARLDQLNENYEDYRRQLLTVEPALVSDSSLRLMPQLGSYSSSQQLLDDAIANGSWSWKVLDRLGELREEFLLSIAALPEALPALIDRRSSSRDVLLNVWRSGWSLGQRQLYARRLLQLSSRVQPLRERLCDLQLARQFLLDPGEVDSEDWPEFGSAACFSDDRYDLFLLSESETDDSMLLLELVSGRVQRLDTLDDAAALLLQRIDSGEYRWIRSLRSLRVPPDQMDDRSSAFQQTDGCEQPPPITALSDLEPFYALPELPLTRQAVLDSSLNWRQSIQALWNHFRRLHDFMVEDAEGQPFARGLAGIPQRLSGVTSVLPADMEEQKLSARQEVEARAWSELLTAWLFDPRSPPALLEVEPAAVEEEEASLSPMETIVGDGEQSFVVSDVEMELESGFVPIPPDFSNLRQLWRLTDASAVFPFPTQGAYLYHALIVHYYAARLADFLPEYGAHNEVAMGVAGTVYADRYIVHSKARSEAYPSRAALPVNASGRFALIWGIEQRLREQLDPDRVRSAVVDTAFTDIVLPPIRILPDSEEQLRRPSQIIELTLPAYNAHFGDGQLTLTAEELQLLAFRLQTHFKLLTEESSSNVALGQDGFSDAVKTMLPPTWQSAFSVGQNPRAEPAELPDEMELDEEDLEEEASEESGLEDELSLEAELQKEAAEEDYVDIAAATEARSVSPTPATVITEAPPVPPPRRVLLIHESEQHKRRRISVEDDECVEAEEMELEPVPAHWRSYDSILPTESFSRLLTDREREAHAAWLDALEFFLMNRELTEQGPTRWNAWMRLLQQSGDDPEAALRAYTVGQLGRRTRGSGFDDSSNALLLLNLPWQHSYAWVYMGGLLLYPYSRQLGGATLDAIIRADTDYEATAAALSSLQTLPEVYSGLAQLVDYLTARPVSDSAVYLVLPEEDAAVAAEQLSPVLHTKRSPPEAEEGRALPSWVEIKRQRVAACLSAW